MVGMDGILNIDKPAGLTSHDVVNRVRRLLGLRRVGHAGTLDPLATGVLLVCTGRATRLVEYVTALPKSYRAVIELGKETSTYDAEGEVTATKMVAVSRPELEQTLSQFQGTIDQMPPLYSAIKQGGQPLYKLARQGVAVVRQARPVTIYEIQILAWESPRVELVVNCSAGTYIRSLAHDLGQALGCGGYLAALRRLAVGPFTAEQAVTLDGLTPETIGNYLQLPGRAIPHLPHLAVDEQMVGQLLQGRPIIRHTPEPEGAIAAAFAPAGTLVGLLVARPGIWQPHKILQ